MSIIKFLFGFNAPVKAKPYFLWGIGLFFFKFGLEYLIALKFNFHSLTLLEFLSPMISTKTEVFSSQTYKGLPGFLWGVESLIFLWIGLSMTSRRLYDAKVSPWFVMFFFVPVVNIVAMIAFCLLPSRGTELAPLSTKRKSSSVLFKEHFFTMLMIAIPGTLLTGAMVVLLKSYGLTLFVGSPFILGLILGYVVNRKEFITIPATLELTVVTALMWAGLLLIFAIEGVMCIAMAFPLALVGAVIGSISGAKLAQAKAQLRSIAILPILAITTVTERELTPTYYDAITSEVIIDAPIEEVWKNVVVFPKLKEPTEFLFKAGISYPIEATIEGTGVGAIRYCKFNAGDFVEPITKWDEPYQLSFDVKFQPKPMTEMTFWEDIEAPHLEGFFESKKGQFLLEKLGDNKTKLKGTTWYQMQIFPSAYWKIISDHIVHKIHLRVLNHIKEHSEK